MLKKLLFISFIVFIRFSFAQNKSFSIHDDYYHLRDKRLTSDQRTFLSVVDSGSLLYFNGKQPFLLLKNFQTAVSFDSVYKYYSEQEFLSQGGFFKDGKTKTIYGKPAARYSLFKPELDVHLWVSEGVQEKSIFCELLDNMGLLKNIHKGQAIIAVEYRGEENDLSEIKYYNDNRRTTSYLEGILYANYRDTATENCYERSRTSEQLEIQNLRDTVVTFKFRSTYVTSFFDADGDFRDAQTSTQYFNEKDDEALNISKMTKQDGADYNAYYTNQNSGLFIYGEVADDKFIIRKAENRHYNLCDELYPLKPAGTDTLADGSIIQHYMRFEKNKMSVLKYSYDNSPAYRKVANNAVIKDLPNGVVKEVKRIYSTMDRYTYILTSIETGSFTFKLEK